ncbi:PaaX family transcriptional regulator [Actinomadura sp. NBRC 104425]|uniref:PaaX family transcriptional regulator n=1 Tax=Actinomadura sp. NBRC 104425 TaxID=3032204 RepID=UPI0024A60217|nr:PaaX family transcriptional regulator C-terminal domain-containing protein [Actinomadura sp. NBRC 104425]GLZ11625.1 PaaX family transcriptional regulator [Actinomadura sp. NBRC 104425]
MAGDRGAAASGAVPSYTRRQQAAATSARSLLLTVFGEFVLPHGEPVWTSDLLRVTTGLGIEERSARQALNRLAADGWITSQRSGRRVRWALTDHGRVLLRQGAERIYSFSRERRSWDGRWLVLLVSVPESKRDLRHRLRTKLSWVGLGTPAPGVWISPHTAREAEAKQVVDDLGLDAAIFSFCGAFAGIGSERAMVEQAWHLDDLAAAYEDFVREFAGLRPDPGDQVLLAQIRLVNAWRRFPGLDPQLPLELLPPHWIGLRAANVFEDLHRTWHDAAQRRWAALAAGS